jgi:hypothetical protein
MVTSEEPQVWELYVHISFCELLAWQQCSDHAEVWIQLRRSHHTLFDIKSWLRTNMLKLNQDKTELIVFALKHKVKSLTKLQFNFDGAILSESSCVRNLGVFFRPIPQYGAT